jgi:hypothetical protein
MMQVKRMIPELQDRELHWICNFPYFLAPTFHVYDDEEHNSRATGAEDSEDFSDSVAADTSENDTDEEHDTKAAGARAS